MRGVALPQFVGATALPRLGFLAAPEATGFLELGSPQVGGQAFDLAPTSQEQAWNFLVGIVIVLACLTRFNDQFLSPLLITAAMGGL